ncbi:MAG: hypothetical protein N3A65_03240 [candidate division WOR-3 bacterium]|nr:hypothetical protein [candidate division WOR-3 bacterium]
MVLFVIGCSKGERASIMSQIWFYWETPDSLVKITHLEGYKYNGFKMMPLATINGDTLFPHDYYLGATDFYYRAYIDWIDNGDECKFKIDYEEGKGEATDTMPGRFNITAPDTTFILRKGNSLNITWGSASDADWYWLEIYLSYYYIDTSGYYEDFDFYLDTIVDGALLTLSAIRIFPGHVDSVLYGYGDVYVEAVSGSKLEPGSKGNIKGNAVGFFWCVYDTKPTWFGIENLTAINRANRQSEIRKKHQEILREFALENE